MDVIWEVEDERMRRMGLGLEKKKKKGLVVGKRIWCVVGRKVDWGLRGLSLLP